MQPLNIVYSLRYVKKLMNGGMFNEKDSLSHRRIGNDGLCWL